MIPFSKSLAKDDDIDFTCQIALKSEYIANRIGSHGNSEASVSKALPLRFVQYNVQILKDEGDEIDLHTRFKIGKCAIGFLQENMENIY